MKQSDKLVVALLNAALLAACSGNNGLSTTTPTSVTPSLRSQPAYGSHWVKKNLQMESVLYSFANTPDGATPWAGLTNVNGTLYGTTYDGGANNAGTVFKITTSGTQTVLYSFTGGPTDGAAPEAGLTYVGGALYGTTVLGGASNVGTIFKVTTSGTETVLHTFAGGSDGAYPECRLIHLGGALYGGTVNGGANNDGIVFKITTSGSETVLHSFAGYPTDGEYSLAGLTNVGGTLYGTTAGVVQATSAQSLRSRRPARKVCSTVS